MKKIAVDAMGGDFAPQSVVEGVEKARNKYPDLRFMLFGDEQKIREILTSDKNIEIIQTTEVIDMNDEPVKAIRRKKDSSLVRAAYAVKEGKADALFSCGNTGALLAAGLLIVGRFVVALERWICLVFEAAAAKMISGAEIAKSLRWCSPIANASIFNLSARTISSNKSLIL